MPWGAAAAAAVVVGGSIIAGNKAASASEQAAQQQRDAGAAAAEMQKFRPVGITTGFGNSQFTQGPYGVDSASYTLTPEMQSIRDQMLAQAGQYNPQQIGQAAQPLYGGAAGMFSAGQQLMPTSTDRTASPESQALAQQFYAAQQGLMPTSYQAANTPEAQAYAAQLQGMAGNVMPTSYDTTAAAQQYQAEQQALLAPQREQQLAQTRNQLYQTGRGGLATGGTSGGMQATNPEMAAYYNAIAQQDRQIAASATDTARARLQQDITLGSQLGGQALTTQQQDLATQRANMLQNLNTSLGYGTQGLTTGMTAEEFARSKYAQDLGLSGTAYTSGAGLLGNIPSLTSQGYGPLQTQLGLAGSIEEMGQQSLQLGMQVGGQNAAAGARAGQSLLSSGMAAAQSQQAANSWSPWGTALTGLGQAYMGGSFGGMMGGASSTPSYKGPSYGTNPSFSNSWFDTNSYD